VRAKDLREMVVVGDECDAEAPAVIDPLTMDDTKLTKIFGPVDERLF